MKEYNNLPATLRVYILVVNAVKYITEKMEEKNENLGLDKVSIISILLIHYIPKINQRQVAESLGLDKTTTGRMINRLIIQGFVKKDDHNNDSRSNFLVTTNKSKPIVDAIEKHINSYIEILEYKMDDNDKVNVRKILRLILDNSISFAKQGENYEENKKMI